MYELPPQINGWKDAMQYGAIVLEQPTDITKHTLGRFHNTRKLIRKFLPRRDGTIEVLQRFAYDDYACSNISLFKGIIEECKPLVYEEIMRFYKKYLRKEFYPVDVSRVYSIAMAFKQGFFIETTYLLQMSPAVMLDIKHVSREPLPQERFQYKTIKLEPGTYRCILV